MPTRTSRLYRDCDPCLNGGRGFTLSPYLSRLVNNIEVTGAATAQTAPDFIIHTLAVEGIIAFEKLTGEWVKVSPASSKKVMGLIPSEVKLWSEELQQWSAPLPVSRGGNICVFPANAEFYPLANKIKELVVSLNTVEDNISQNLDNLRELAVVVTKGKRFANQLKALNRQRQQGTTAVGILTLPEDKDDANSLLTEEELSNALSVVTLSPNANNYLDTYLELKKDYREELNNVIGVTEVAEKTERRINSEMELIENSSYAMIDLLIDNINKYAKFYGVDIHAHRAHSGCNEHIDEALSEVPLEEQINASDEESSENESESV